MERYLVLMMCIAHTKNGVFFKNKLKLSPSYWLQFLTLYLSMLSGFHSSIEREKVCLAAPAISLVKNLLQMYFSCQNDSNGYCIPQMHGMAKLCDYVCLYGSTISFYGGPGEASHKVFVKMPGLKK